MLLQTASSATINLRAQYTPLGFKWNVKQSSRLTLHVRQMRGNRSDEIPASVPMSFIFASIKQSLLSNASLLILHKIDFPRICSYSSRFEHANRPNPDLYNSDRVCPPHTYTSLPGRSTHSPNTLTLQSGKPTVNANRCSCKPYEQSRCVRCPAIPCSSSPLFVCGQTGT